MFISIWLVSTVLSKHVVLIDKNTRINEYRFSIQEFSVIERTFFFYSITMIYANKNYQFLLFAYLIILTIFQSDLIIGQACQNDIRDFFVSFHKPKRLLALFISSFSTMLALLDHSLINPFIQHQHQSFLYYLQMVQLYLYLMFNRKQFILDQVLFQHPPLVVHWITHLE